MQQPRFGADGVGHDPALLPADGLDRPGIGLPLEAIGQCPPTIAGVRTVADLLTLYESYRKTRGRTGHIAVIGGLRESSTLFFARLTQVFEPRARTIVHGFRGVVDVAPRRDGNGMGRPRIDRYGESGPSTGRAGEIHRTVLGLIADGNPGHDIHLHGIDVTRDLDAFFAERPGIEFKLVVLDVNDVEATRASLPRFWPRLVPGGVLVLDESGSDRAAYGAAVVRALLPDVPIRSYGFTDQPAYIMKPGCTTEVIDVA